VKSATARGNGVIFGDLYLRGETGTSQVTVSHQSEIQFFNTGRQTNRGCFKYTPSRGAAREKDNKKMRGQRKQYLTWVGYRGLHANCSTESLEVQEPGAKLRGSQSGDEKGGENIDRGARVRAGKGDLTNRSDQRGLADEHVKANS